MVSTTVPVAVLPAAAAWLWVAASIWFWFWTFVVVVVFCGASADDAERGGHQQRHGDSIGHLGLSCVCVTVDGWVVFNRKEHETRTRDLGGRRDYYRQIDFRPADTVVLEPVLRHAFGAADVAQIDDDVAFETLI